MITREIMHFNFPPLLLYGLTLIFAVSHVSSYGQQPSRPSSAKIFQSIKKLNVLGNVLYFGAHPDDENPTFIAYMANEKLYNTAYFSLTRGDGGQNMIGTEVKENLGIIRTQELLQARRIDGGQQFFSRAVDFGFSKSAEEVFTIWDKEKLLEDAVWVIRKFRPDVIVTRFPPDERAGHGHHIASAILAEEAFDAAADPARFPQQLKYVNAWKTKRLVWNAGMWWNQRRDAVDKNDEADCIKLDVGIYNALLGKSYGEIAAESRSQHRTQGFGTVGFRGNLIEYFKHVKGEKASADLLDGVNTTWNREKGYEKISALFTKAAAEYDFAQPHKVVSLLFEAKEKLERLPDGYWKNVKLAELDKVITDALGLYFEVTTSESAYTPGETAKISVEAINRSSVNVVIDKIKLPFQRPDSVVKIALHQDQKVEFASELIIPASSAYSQPYWLREVGSLGMYGGISQTEVGLAQNPPVAQFGFGLIIDGKPFHIKADVIYQKSDPILGEIYQPLAVTPPVFTSINEKVYLFDQHKSKKVSVSVKSGKQNVSGQVSLKTPAGWRVFPQSAAYNLAIKGAEQNIDFELFPPDSASEGEIYAVATFAGQDYNRSLAVICHSHIPTQLQFPVAKARVVKTEILRKGDLIGYVKGAGDLVPASLQQIGYQVSLLEDQDITAENLEKFDAVILGVRAYNILERLKVTNSVLLKYVENGGNLIVQYNSDEGLLLKDFGPYPFTVSKNRVTVEAAEVRFVNPECQVLNYPNKITEKDFEGWVQERSLYQPASWSDKYETVISCNDPGSEVLDSGILVARYGKGNYVYTTLSWFRQLPAGVPGAYRMFSNLISLGK
ncbi:PIG-L family deacetylase [Dyadobacter sp. CY312]|uniref:PIG-L family deacetylase n=1 Tax=Dyadobacter sp. CY312 TaxID=2907303 RepID=UPI001F253713|nr:PIG-L family deacetylase [Dyadobacter sp. CY312]MCE7040341.1 PIG-L family deacetylase [Dyadobacter sp. CY312]